MALEALKALGTLCSGGHGFQVGMVSVWTPRGLAPHEP